MQKLNKSAVLNSTILKCKEELMLLKFDTTTNGWRK